MREQRNARRDAQLALLDSESSDDEDNLVFSDPETQPPPTNNNLPGDDREYHGTCDEKSHVSDIIRQSEGVRRSFELDQNHKKYRDYSQTFLESATRPMELKELWWYQLPSGDITSDVSHLFHWAPECGQKPHSEIFNPSNSLLAFAFALFLTLNESLVSDPWLCREELNERSPDGILRRCSDIELYGIHPCLCSHHSFKKNLFEASEATTWIIWGTPARKMFQSWYGNEIVFAPPSGKLVRNDSHFIFLFC
jgi:hypothetical protein